MIIQILKFFLLSFFIFSCSDSVSKKVGSDSLEKIDLTLKEQSEIKLSQYFDGVKYVKLELTDESMIGNVSAIKHHSGKIYILDSYVAKAVFVFNEDGEYINKIGTQGKGRGEFRFLIRDFNISGNKIYLLVDQNRVFSYAIDGSFIKEFRLPIRNVRSFYPIAEKWIFISSGIREDSESNRVYICDNKFKVKKEFFSYHLEDIPIRGTRENFEYENNYISYIPQCDTLFQFTKEGKVLPKYLLKIPEEKNITNEDIQQLRQEYKRKELVDKFKEKIVVVMNAIFSERLTHIRYMSSGKTYWAMMQKGELKLCQQSELINDVDQCAVLPKLLYYDQNKNVFVGIINPSDFYIEDKKEDSYLMGIKISMMDNPIIAYYEIK